MKAPPKTITAGLLRKLAAKAVSLADAIDMDAAAGTPTERAQLSIISGKLRKHEMAFKRYATALVENGSRPPKRTATDIEWITNLLTERKRNGKPIERRDAHAFANRHRIAGKSVAPRSNS